MNARAGRSAAGQFWGASPDSFVAFHQKHMVPACTAWPRLGPDLVPAGHQGGPDWPRLNLWTCTVHWRIKTCKDLAEALAVS